MNTCVICGNEFVGRSSQVSCSKECKKIRKGITEKAWNEQKNGNDVQVKIIPPSPVQNSFLRRGLVSYGKP